MTKLLRTSLIFFIFLLISSCTVNKKPEFVRIANIKLIESDKSSITLKAEAIFNNDNHVGGNLEIDNINIFFLENLVASVSSETFKIPAKDQFIIPLITKIETRKLINKNQINNIFESFINREIELKYKGDIVYRLSEFSYTFKIEDIQKLKLKL